MKNISQGGAYLEGAKGIVRERSKAGEAHFGFAVL